MIKRAVYESTCDVCLGSVVCATKRAAQRVARFHSTEFGHRTHVKRVSASEAEVTRARETHDCMDNAVPYRSNGALGHGYECGVCGKFLQAG